MQNAATRIVCQTPRRQHHSADLLKDLHWFGCRCLAESTTRLPSSVIKPSNCNNLRILLVYSRHRQSRVLRSSTSDLLSTQSSSTNIAARRFSCCAPPFGTVFLHLCALLIVSLVLGLSSRPTCSQDICSRSTVRASDTLMSVFARYKFVTYLLT